jgi:hypothetical protein
MIEIQVDFPLECTSLLSQYVLVVISLPLDAKKAHYCVLRWV